MKFRNGPDTYLFDLNGIESAGLAKATPSILASNSIREVAKAGSRNSCISCQDGLYSVAEAFHEAWAHYWLSECRFDNRGLADVKVMSRADSCAASVYDSYMEVCGAASSSGWITLKPTSKSALSSILMRNPKAYANLFG